MTSLLNLTKKQVLQRAQWGCPDGETSPLWPIFPNEPTHIMIHHTEISVPPSAGSEAVCEIWKCHALGQKWGDVGYHFLIDPSGRIYEGRAGGIHAVGGHFKNGNQGTLAIALLGDFMTEAATGASVDSLVDLLSGLCRLLLIDPLGNRVHLQTGLTLPTICGHREGNPSTTCPGDSLYERLPEIRGQVIGLLSQRGFLERS